MSDEYSTTINREEKEYEITVKIGYESADPFVGWPEQMWLEDVVDANGNEFQITNEEEEKIIDEVYENIKNGHFC